MSNTVSTDLARRLQEAGLRWEPKVGDWVTWGEELELVCDVARDGFVRFNRWSSWIYSSRCLWLPTGDDCLELIRARGLYPAVAAYPESGAGPEHWGAWVNDRQDQNVGERQGADNPAEAAGLALAAILEGEKANG